MSTALALLSASASAEETVPVNVTPPTISPNLPFVGKLETANQGTWSGSPTSFTYVWYRCSGTSSCVSIPSATSSTYEPTSADLGKNLRVMVTAFNAKGSGSAISAITEATKAAGVASSLSWSSCALTGTGVYTSASCSTKGAGGFEWYALPSAWPTGFSAAGTSPFSLRFPFFGESQIAITCSNQTAEGTLENPGESKPGVVSNTSFKFSGCVVSEPPNCKVSGSAMNFNLMKGTVIKSEAGPSVRFEPVSGSTIITVKIEKGAGSCAASGVYALGGSFTGIDNSSTSSLEFTKASSGGSFAGGTFEGTTKLTAGGGAVKVNP